MQGLQHYPNHAGPGEAHEQASCASAADDVAVLGARSMTIVQVPEHRCFSSQRRHIWDIHMRRLRGFVPAGETAGDCSQTQAEWGMAQSRLQICNAG